MPEPGALLASLAEAAGIEPGYEDIWHRWHGTSERAMRAVLECMGYDVHDDAAAADGLAAVQRERWQEILPPVIVRHANDVRRTAILRLPASKQNASLSLRLVREGGEIRDEAIRLPALERYDQADLDGRRYSAWSLPLPPVPMGYHRLSLHAGEQSLCEVLYVQAPQRCYRPEAVQGSARTWGPAVQLYALRSARNWGIGDFTDLQLVMEQWSAEGADLVALNPLHALFPQRPRQASPYSPSSRLFLNVLYLDVEAIEDFRESEEAQQLRDSPAFQSTLHALRASELVDHAGVAAAKLGVLEPMYAAFRRNHLAQDTPRAQAFRSFQAVEGHALRRHALFETLQEHLQSADPATWGWPVWPRALRDFDSEAVARFERAHLDRIEFFEYLQWQADLQLEAAARRARKLGMGIGLYGDLAVSVDRGGAEAWSNRQLYSIPAAVGAPPDEFNMNGQNWGLPPWIPRRLRRAGYAPFIAMLQRTMRHMGAVRIDHVMGLMRLYWIPQNASAAQGAYVRYALDDLLGILMLESERNRCMVIGEDLGTVPDEVRQALHAAGVLSYRLLYFERDDEGFYQAPEHYPAQALVAASTHDLPTLAGFWEGRDLVQRNELGLFPSDQARQEQVVVRAEARAKLLLMLERARLLPPGATADPQSMPAMTPQLSRALHVFLARTPCQIMLVQLEDVLGMVDQMNMPGTTDRHPNWQRRLPLPLERWPQEERFVDLCSALREVRGAPQRPGQGATPRSAMIPCATYRLQLNRDFTLAQARALVPYLSRLGISHVYCSPLLRARPGSTHGYDIIDHDTINPEIGDDAALERFVAALHEHGMGLILDIVPNHMGIMGSDNAWWLDVLENGQASLYADFFDIDWHPLNTTLNGRVLVPVLGNHYGRVLESGELELKFDREQGSFSLWYFTHRLPIDPARYPLVLEPVLRLAPFQVAAQAVREELESLIAAFAHLPSHDSQDGAARVERNRDKEVHKRRLAALIAAQPVVAEGIDAALEAMNGTSGAADSFDALHELIERQAYRLAYWRVASDEINYRRFFDINDLAALRMENEVVFEATHRRVLAWLREGKLDGLRIDHPDGLFDPRQYFRRLQEHSAMQTGAYDIPRQHSHGWPLYLVVEKITAAHEHLPQDWAVHGTTGYDFTSLVNGLFVDAGARARMQRIYLSFTGEHSSWEEVTYQAKRLIMRTALASELTVLTNHLLRLAHADRRTCDFTHNSLRDALSEVVACFPVYRTYVADGVSDSDRRYIGWAIGLAKGRSRAADVGAFDFLASVLTAQPAPGAPPGREAEMRAFTRKLQQFTAPVMAKGVEDTAFYRSFPLVSLNEVGGGGPQPFGISIKAFHSAMQRQARDWPHTMLATSTHDTKRSEDVRMRIDVLSEFPASWRLTLRHFSRLNRRAKREVDGEPAPSRRDEYLLYQILLGSVPVLPPSACEDRASAPDEERHDSAMSQVELDDYRQRVEVYMLKAVREAKVHTSWINVNEAYEDALKAFVSTLLARSENNAFLDDLIERARLLARLGMLNSLSQTLLKLTAPGVPDIYRGTETADLSLVDPDNRRPVDYARLGRLLAAVHEHDGPRESLLRRLLETIEDGRAKLFVTWKLLSLRRRHPEVFADGGYQALSVTGARADHICAFARSHERGAFVVVAPRLYGGLPGAGLSQPLGCAVWSDTAVQLDAPDKPWQELFSNRVLVGTAAGRLLIGEILCDFPIALLAAFD